MGDAQDTGSHEGQSKVKYRTHHVHGISGDGARLGKIIREKSMGEGRPDNNDVKDTDMNSGAGELRGVPSIGEAFGGWYKNWRPCTVVGWGIKNSIE